MPNSSRVARVGNLTFRVMGGKSGKKRQETARSGKVSGNLIPSPLRSRRRGTTAGRMRWRDWEEAARWAAGAPARIGAKPTCLALYVVGKVQAVPDGVA